MNSCVLLGKDVDKRDEVVEKGSNVQGRLGKNGRQRHL